MEITPGNGGLDVTGPAGVGIHARGRDFVLLIALALVGGAIVWSNLRIADTLGPTLAVQTSKLDQIIQRQDSIRQDHKDEAIRDAQSACLAAVPLAARAQAVLSNDPCRYLLDLVHGRPLPPARRPPGE
jgi:hypothetical protein